MSISWKPTSVIHTPLSDKVINQINARKRILSRKSNRPDQEILYLNSNTGWIKVSSGVDVEGEGSSLAKSNILFGGTFDQSKGKKRGILTDYSSYEFSEQYGYRPMAGITNFTVENLDSFGALRQGIVEFKVNDLESLNKLEKLYLRPGYSILVEYGHSFYVTNNNNFESSPLTLQNFFDNLPEDEQEHRSLKIVELIEELREKSGFNYDGFLGRISNFSWTFNPDTTYDCNLTVMGYGSIIESLSALSSTTILSSEEEAQDKSTSIGNDFEKVLNEAIEKRPYAGTDVKGNLGIYRTIIKSQTEGLNEAVAAVTHFGQEGTFEDNTLYSEFENRETQNSELNEKIRQLNLLKEGDIFEFRNKNDKRRIVTSARSTDRNYIIVHVKEEGKVIKKGWMKTPFIRFTSETDITDFTFQNQPDIDTGFKEGDIENDETTINYVGRVTIEPAIQESINKKFK